MQRHNKFSAFNLNIYNNMICGHALEEVAREQKFVYAEGKKTQNWFVMPLAGQLSEVEDGSDGEFETAIAAAAYAITLQEEESSLNQEKSVEKLGGPLIKTKTKREGSRNKLTDSSKISRWFSGKEAKEDGKSPGTFLLSFHHTKFTKHAWSMWLSVTNSNYMLVVNTVA